MNRSCDIDETGPRRHRNGGEVDDDEDEVGVDFGGVACDGLCDEDEEETEDGGRNDEDEEEAGENGGNENEEEEEDKEEDEENEEEDKESEESENDEGVIAAELDE